MNKFIICAGICLLILSGCDNWTDKDAPIEEANVTDTPQETPGSEKTLPDVGDFLFNAEGMESIEISGKDLGERKIVETSVEIEKGKSATLRVRRDEYGNGIGMVYLAEPEGAELVTCLDKSLDDGCVFKEDFYYQMCGYDFDGDGVKEIVVAGGNKKDVLELRIFHINPGEEMKDIPEPVTEINGGMKSYVNAEGGICVQDSGTHTTIYAYGEEK